MITSLRPAWATYKTLSPEKKQRIRGVGQVGIIGVYHHAQLQHSFKPRSVGLPLAVGNEHLPTRKRKNNNIKIAIRASHL
jgi:hypothetical protein